MSGFVSYRPIILNMNLLCGIRYDLENKKPLLSLTEALLLPARQSSININIESIVFIFSCLCGRSRGVFRRVGTQVIFSCLCGRSHQRYQATRSRIIFSCLCGRSRVNNLVAMLKAIFSCLCGRSQ